MAIVKEERIGECRLILGDCLGVMPLLEAVDAVVTDPPYGIGESGGKSAGRGNLAGADLYTHKDWDTETAEDAVQRAISMAKNSIVFGGNYYDLPPTSCWLVWDKENGANDFADCELAWTNLPKAVRRLKFLWNGCMRKERDVPREHPTQKPVGVMKWCIGHLPDTAQIILDPFAGSGTTGVAAVQSGKSFVGIERDPEYFEIMCRRIDEASKQPADLFVAPPQAPTQEAMDV